MQKTIYSRRHEILRALLKEVRTEKGLTQKELASRLKTPQSRISDVESGERRLDLAQLFDYCRAVGIELEVFVARFTQQVREAGEDNIRGN